MKPKKIVLFLFIILVIRSVYVIYLYNFKYEVWENIIITVDIMQIEKRTDEAVTYIVKYNGDKFLLYIKDNNVYNYGDRLKILCSNFDNKKYNNPFEFNYKMYLNSNCLVSRLYCIKVIDKEKFGILGIDFIHKLRDKISINIDDKMNSKYSNIFKSIVYGDDTYLEDDTEKMFTSIGLGHILCVSGGQIVYLLLAFENMTNSKKNNVIKCILLFYFYIISLFNVSLLRAIIMYILKLIYKNSGFFKRWIITAIIILIINPYYILNISIIFSFLSVLSMYIFNSQIESKIYAVAKIKSRGVVKEIIENISMTISSQILIVPFQIYYFGVFPLISVFSNVFICFTLNILMIFSFNLFIMFFIPIISDILIIICRYIMYFFIFQIEILDKVNYFNISLPKLSILVFVAYYSLILIYLYGKKIILISWRRRALLKRILSILKILCIIYIFFWYIYVMYFEKYVIFFNVGQGNMALIHSNNVNVIIDIGSTKNGNAGYIMSSFLKAKNIKKIDIILLTHMHDDHVNGIENLIENNIKINRIGYVNLKVKTNLYNKVNNIIKNNNISKLELAFLDKIEIGDIQIEILNNENIILDENIENANSTIYLVKFKNKDMLFMGDSTKKTEQDLLKNMDVNKLSSIDILQVSHHGSKTSSDQEFLSKMSENTIAIISAEKEAYGHPDSSVIELLNKYNFKIYITEKNGAIKF